MSAELLSKHPAENRNFFMDFGNEPELTDETIATIVSVVATPESGTNTVTIGSTAITGTKVRAKIAGGTDQQTYTVVFTVTTSGGATLVLCGGLQIDDCLP
jgi:hypothetical protein